MLKQIISAYRYEFRNWMRQRTRPISVEEAEEKTLLWAKMYAFVSIVFLIYCTHKIYHNPPQLNKASDASKEFPFSRVHDTDKPLRYIGFSGFTKVIDVTFSPDELKRYVKKRNGKSSATEDPSNSNSD